MNRKISACMIVRDESAGLEACLKSIRPHVDEICIVDTGSKDNSPAIASKFADRFEVWTECNDKESGLINDFAMARNRSLDLATNDWAFWIDGDDILKDGEALRKLVQQTPPNAERAILMAPYEYSHDDRGNVTCLHVRERLVYPRRDFRWRTPCHEVMIPAGEGSVAAFGGPTEAFRVVHRRKQLKKTGEPGRNLRILERYIKEVGESDVRALYYLGVEYGSSGQIGASCRVLQRYIELANWSDEKCLAYLELGKHMYRLGHFEKAIDYANRAMDTKAWPEPYWLKARCYHALGSNPVLRNADEDFKKAAFFGKQGMKLPDANTLLFMNPTERYAIQEILSTAYWKCGDLNDAIEACEFGLQALPDNENMKHNLSIFRRDKLLVQVQESIGELRELGHIDDGQALMVSRALSGQYKVEMIGDGKGDGEIMATAEPERTDFARTPDDGCLDVVFFTGPAWEEWNPETLEAGGMGGSETLVWQIGNRLAAMGHRVRVFADCSESQEGLFSGVEWYRWQRYHDLDCDALIASRTPFPVDDQFKVNALSSLLWAHDVHVGESLTPARLMRFDRVLGLSNWHQSFLRQAYQRLGQPGKFHVMRNAIDVDLFRVGFFSKEPSSIVYSSSPDRGLQCLLDVWPRIIDKLPDAKLHVYYGFDNWEKAASGNPDEQAKIAEAKEGLKQDGIEFHGRVKEITLSNAFAYSRVWCYPQWFQETSCLSAMQAVASECAIVTSPIAAVPEAVGPECCELVGEWRSDEYKDLLVEKLLAALNHDGVKSKTDFASLDINTRAKEWDAMLRELVTRNRERVMGDYEEYAA